MLSTHVIQNTALYTVSPARVSHLESVTLPTSLRDNYHGAMSVSTPSDVRDLLARRKKISEFLYANQQRLSELRDRAGARPSLACVLEFADNITMTLHAPQDWVPGRPLIDLGGHPPAPQFEQMRVGALALLHEEFGSQSVLSRDVCENSEAMNSNMLLVEDDEDRGDDDEEDDEDNEEGDDDGTAAEAALKESFKAPEVEAVHKSRQVNIDFFSGDSDEED